ncbi:MAG: transposase [Planctomycetota bacterium]
MPRTARASVGGMCYHVTNRGNARAEVFHKEDDYAAFVRLVEEACERLPMRVLAYCLMPNHFHLVLWPHGDGDLSRWMQWLLTSHVRRYHRHYHTSGHVWQGRFKAFPIQQDEHLLTVLRYVERNPLRANLVERAQQWRWSSAGMWRKKELPAWLHVGPVRYEGNWLQWLNRPQTEAEEAALRKCIARGRPYGGPLWRRRTAKRLGLESSLRPRGRPRSRPKT